uniref:sushi, von Willebrand factor type A, EGF and pentraxin domain-containing protein 1-like n=1 Tax=Ciona intestinalis TaxID=7719 RepID=UPI000EF4F3FA
VKLLHTAGYLSAIQLPQPGNQTNVATGTTNLTITATVTTSPSSCSWSGTGLASTEFYSATFGCDTSTTSTHNITCTDSAGVINTTLTYLTALTSNTNISLICDLSVLNSLSMIIKACQPNTTSGVIATVSSSPCGFGCAVQYSCEPGHTGNNVTATCQEDATFDNNPVCVPITCSNSDLLCSNPQYCFNETGSTNAGANVTTQCNTGYSGSVSATCGNDGSWTITAQSPCPALCPVSDITSSPGRCTTATGDILEGQSITVTCCDSYKGASTMAICTSDRSWSNLPTCTKPVTCSLSNLSSISNNVLQSNNSTLSVNETKIISCAAEYSGSGATASCSDNGTLTLTDTNCTKTPTPADTTAMTTDESVTSTASTTSTIRNDSNGGPTPSTLSTGAIIGIVIGCLVAAALITFVLIAIFCTEICCCTFSILCLSWGTKKPDPEPDITIPELKKNTQPDGPNGEGVEP